MYCSSCGVAVVQDLSYCNFCGAKLTSAKNDSVIKSPEVRPETLVAAMVLTFVFGLAAITVLMGVMKAVLRLEFGPIMGIAMMSFLILILLEGVFIRLLFRRQRGAEKAKGPMLFKTPGTNELDAAHARALPEPMPSVTEHTTRAFDPIYSEHTSK